jgi:hypothetical protein
MQRLSLCRDQPHDGAVDESGMPKFLGLLWALKAVDWLLCVDAPDEHPPALLRDHQLRPIWLPGVADRH